MKRTLIALMACLAAFVNVQAQLLWKVTGNGLAKPSYIMGTYHLANTSFANSVKGLHDALNACEQVYGELNMSQLDTQAMQGMQSTMMLPQGQTLDSLLTADQLARLNAFMTKLLGADFSNPLLAPMKQMTPAALNTQFQVLMCMKLEGGFNPNEQFDTYFQKEAKKQNKAVGGLETLDYQMKVLFSAPMPRQIEQLMCLVDNYDYQTELLKRTIKAFYAEDMNAIQQIYEEKLHNTCDMTPAEENALIYTRNANWAKALPNIMSQRSTLVAVGAAHLPGPRGLLQLLKDAGYTVTPISK